MYPRYFLSSHFWSIEQKHKFYEEIVRYRLSHNLRVFRFMQSRLDQLKENPEQFKKMRHILGLLGSGLHPTSQQILDIKDVFTKGPYSIDSLPRHHLV